MASSAPNREGLKERDRGERALLGLARPASAPDRLRQRAKQVALLAPIACHAVVGEPALKRDNRVLVQTGQEAFTPMGLEDVGPLVRRHPIGEAQRPGVLSGRLAVRAQHCCARRGCRRVPAYRIRVAGRLGMVREPGEIASAVRRGQQARERAPVQSHLPVRRERLLHREPGQFVAERDRVAGGLEHPRGQALLEACRRDLCQRLQQPDFGRLRDDRDRVDQRPRRLAESRGSGEDGISHRFRNAVGGRRDGLGDEERVAARARVQDIGVNRGGRRQRPDGVARQATDVEPGDEPAARELTQEQSERIRAAHLLVPKARHDQRRHPIDPSHDQPEHVEGCLVRPVDVLHHHHGGPLAGELAQDRDGHVMRCSTRRHLGFEFPADDLRNVEQRP